MIVIELNVAEALNVLGVMQDRALTLSKLAAIATGVEREIAEMQARSATKVMAKLVRGLYPEDDQPIVTAN